MKANGNSNLNEIHGTFLCFGANVEPRLIVLNETRMQFMQDKMTIAETRCDRPEEERARVYKEFFYAGVQWAVPAWSKEAMLMLVKDDTGSISKAVQAMAAMIFSERYEKVYNGVVLVGPPDAKPKGGQPAIIDKPKPRKPTGGNAVKLKSKTPAMARA